MSLSEEKLRHAFEDIYRDLDAMIDLHRDTGSIPSGRLQRWVNRLGLLCRAVQALDQKQAHQWREPIEKLQHDLQYLASLVEETPPTKPSLPTSRSSST